jgi:translation initiation factor 2B subunit (eIF-2B alpha/beta/delta family)
MSEEETIAYLIKMNNMEDNVNHPKWYTQHPSGIECIEITRHYCFSIGNAIKYLWRAGLKKEMGLEDVEKEKEDLKKAIWYIMDRIKQLENDKTGI